MLTLASSANKTSGSIAKGRAQRDAFGLRPMLGIGGNSVVGVPDHRFVSVRLSSTAALKPQSVAGTIERRGAFIDIEQIMQQGVSACLLREVEYLRFATGAGRAGRGQAAQDAFALPVHDCDAMRQARGLVQIMGDEQPAKAARRAMREFG